MSAESVGLTVGTPIYDELLLDSFMSNNPHLFNSGDEVDS